MYICIFFMLWYKCLFLTAFNVVVKCKKNILCSGVRMSHCSPSGRVSLKLSACRRSHACQLAGWTLFESSGREPSMPPWVSRTLQACGIPDSKKCQPTSETVKLNLICGQLDSKFPMCLQLQCSPAPLCHATVKMIPAWSAAPWPPRSSWKVCNTVASCLSNTHLLHKMLCQVIPSLSRSGLGQLGDLSSEPDHWPVCSLQFLGSNSAVSGSPWWSPDQRLTGILQYWFDVLNCLLSAKKQQHEYCFPSSQNETTTKTIWG